MSLTHFWILHFLWLLPLTGLIFLFSNRRRKKALTGFADRALIARLTDEEKKGRWFLKGLLIIMVLGLLFFSLSGPRWGSHYQEVSQKGVDIMVLTDVSPSMMVEDVKPNRFERAKREILDLLRVIQGDRVGLVAFSGTAFVQCPLTLDYGALQMFLNVLSTDLLPMPGTDLGSAVETAIAAFDFGLATDKVILLITDGEDNEKRGREAAEKAAKKGVKIFVFGIGDPSGGPVPAGKGKGGFKKDKEGKLIISKLDEAGLEEMASLTGGTYVRSVSGDLDLDLLYFDGIKSSTTAQTLKSGKIRVYEERYPIFVVAAFFLLILEGFISFHKTATYGGGFMKRNKKMKRKPNVTPWILFILCFGIISGPLSFAAEDADALYRQGRFAEAEKAYAQSDMDHPKDLRYRYNRGCAAYQGGNYQGAVSAFSSVIKRATDNDIRYKAAFNAGNAAFKQGDYDSAITRYKQAIGFNPLSSEAKYNLELALRALEKQKKQEQKDSDPKKHEEKKKKEGSSKSDRSKDAQDKAAKDENADQKKQDQKKEQEPSENTTKDKSRKEDGEKKKRDREAGEEPKDLKGELRAQAPSADMDKRDVTPDNETLSSMDRQKAEALLDNIKEDRSRFSRYMLPRRHEEGSFSGKDW